MWVEIILILFLLSWRANSDWVSVPISSYQYNFVSAAWQSSLNAVLVGTRDASGCILYTTNSGDSWTVVSASADVTVSTGSSLSEFPRLSDVAHISYGGVDYFIVVGYDKNNGYATSYRSTNGGASWIEGTRVSTDSCRWYSVSLGSNGAAYAVGYKTTGGFAAVYGSTNALSSGAFTWTDLDNGALSWPSATWQSAIQFNDVATIDGVNVIAVGKDREKTPAIGVVFFSNNGDGTASTTWTKSTLSADLSLQASFISVSMHTTTAFIVASGYIGVTSTYGSTWEYSGAVANGVVPATAPPAAHVVSALSATEVYLASSSGYILSGAYVAGTSLTWTTEKDTSGGSVFYCIAMYSHVHGIAGVSANTASGATSNSLLVMFTDPTAVPTPMPTAIPTFAPSPAPTFSATLYSGVWSVVSAPGSSSVGNARVFTGSCWLSTSTVVLVGGAGDEGIIVKSSDEGRIWSGTTYPEKALSTQFSDIACQSTYAVVIADKGYVHYSSDSASSFTEHATRLTYDLYAVAIGSNSVVYIAAASGRVYTSVLGTWTFSLCSSSAMHTASKTLYGIASFDGSIVYAVGAGGVIYYSVDTAGSAWTVANSGVSVDLYSISCGSSHSCFAGGIDGTLLQTIDGGVSWSALSPTGISGISGANIKHHLIRMIDSKVAFVASDKGVILSTLDAGATWTVQTSLAVGNPLRTLSLYQSNFLVLADSDGRAYLRLQTSPTGQPTKQPSTQPTTQPSVQPSMQPSKQPTGQPSGSPTGEPTFAMKPSGQPTRQPTGQPSHQPTGQPSVQPFGQPSSQPSVQPSGQPSHQPTSNPTCPTGRPSRQPSDQPTARPSSQPTSVPTSPTGKPSGQPSGSPTGQPSAQPSVQPTQQVQILVSFEVLQTLSGITPFDFFESSVAQSVFEATVAKVINRKLKASNVLIDQTYGRPTAEPTPYPTATPTALPTIAPTAIPTAWPSKVPTPIPTSSAPTITPTPAPTPLPSVAPSPKPTSEPSATPSTAPSPLPTVQPSALPSPLPSAEPSPVPTTSAPSPVPTSSAPTPLPTAVPSTSAPSPVPTSSAPTPLPTAVPSTSRRRLLASAEDNKDVQEILFYQQQQEKIDQSVQSRRQLQATTDVKYTIMYTLQQIGSSNAAAIYANYSSTLSASITSGTFTTTLQAVAFSYSCAALGVAQAAKQINISTMSTSIAHTTRPPSAAPTLYPTHGPTMSPTKYYTLTLTYLEFQVVAALCSIVGMMLILLGSYWYVKYERSRSRFHQALQNASMTKEDRALRWGCCRIINFIGRYLFCLFICFSAKTAEEREAEEIARMKREGKKKREGCFCKCWRWLCCFYCCCRMCYCCLSCCFPTWCPKRIPEEDEEDVEAPNSSLNSPGLTGKSGLTNALKAAQSISPGSSASTKARAGKKWGGTVTIAEANSASAQQVEDKKGMFQSLTSMFASKSQQQKQNVTADDQGDEWISMAKTIIKKPLTFSDDLAGKASPVPEDEAKSPDVETRKGFRKNNARGPSPTQQDPTAHGVPILTLSDVNRYNVKKKDASIHSAAPIPIIPGPGEGGFVSFRDNLKLLEQRRAQEAKRETLVGALLNQGKKGYQVKAGAAGNEDSFLRDESTVFLGGGQL